MLERCCGTCVSYNTVKWPNGLVCKKCSDIIPSWNQGCDDYVPLPEPPKEEMG